MKGTVALTKIFGQVMVPLKVYYFDKFSINEKGGRGELQNHRRMKDQILVGKLCLTIVFFCDTCNTFESESAMLGLGGKIFPILVYYFPIKTIIRIYHLSVICDLLFPYLGI